MKLPLHSATFCAFGLMTSLAASAADDSWKKEIDCGYGQLVVDRRELRDEASGETHVSHQIVVRDMEAREYLVANRNGIAKFINEKSELIVPVTESAVGRGGNLFLSEPIANAVNGRVTYVGGSLDGRGNFTIEVFDAVGVTGDEGEATIDWQFHACESTPRE